MQATVKLDALADRLLQSGPGKNLVGAFHQPALVLIDPEVLDTLRSALAAQPNRRIKLVANLPYAIATPLVSNRLIL